MKRRKHRFAWGKLKEWLCDPATLNKEYEAPLCAILSIRRVANSYGLSVRVRNNGTPEMRTLTIFDKKPQPA